MEAEAAGNFKVVLCCKDLMNRIYCSADSITFFSVSFTIKKFIVRQYTHVCEYWHMCTHMYMVVDNPGNCPVGALHHSS